MAAAKKDSRVSSLKIKQQQRREREENGEKLRLEVQNEKNSICV
jgi:hypothetical protein